MSTTKPTIVIAHGAWQPIRSWETCAQKLENLGYETDRVPYPSIDGDDTPVPGLREDYEAVAAALTRQADEGKEIVLLCHSYGGLVGSCAVEGLDIASRKKAGKKGGVIRIIYLTAFMLPKGKTILDGLGGVFPPWMDIQGEKVYAESSYLKEIAFNDMSDEAIALEAKNLRRTGASCFVAPATYEPWAHGVPCAYIFAELDNCIPLPVQQFMASQIGPDTITFSLKAGHCPFLSVPDLTADAIVKAATA